VRGSLPTGATLFGKRRDLIEKPRKEFTRAGPVLPAHLREHEVGERTTCTSRRPVRKDRLPDRPGTKDYPELTSGFLSSVPLVDILWPAVLFGFNYLITDKKEEGGKEIGHGE